MNLAPLFVGQFGPNSNFTGFSSGMNNTARLQGCAREGRDPRHGGGDRRAACRRARVPFGDERVGPVKNVAEPLKFRALEK